MPLPHTTASDAHSPSFCYALFPNLELNYFRQRSLYVVLSLHYLCSTLLAAVLLIANGSWEELPPLRVPATPRATRQARTSSPTAGRGEPEPQNVWVSATSQTPARSAQPPQVAVQDELHSLPECDCSPKQSYGDAVMRKQVRRD